MNCNDPLYQGYHTPVSKCVEAGSNLPYTGIAVGIFVVVGLLLLFFGYLLRRTYR